MSEPAPPVRTSPTVKQSRWPGLIWAVPLAALLVIGYLGLSSFAQRGTDVVITFDTADGLKVDDTEVLYHGLNVGHVVKLALGKDGQMVDVTVRLDPSMDHALVSSTQFWMIGAKPDLTDISSLKAALAGVMIGIEPGKTGKSTRHFRGIDQPPIVLPGTQGTSFSLNAKELGANREGSGVFYRGFQVGNVTNVGVTVHGEFNAAIFIRAPYDKLIRGDTQFWIAAPIAVSLAGRTISAEFQPSVALSGGVEFDTDPDSTATQPPSPASTASTAYTLYTSKGEAEANGSGPKVPYVAVLDESAGNLSAGASVKLGKFRIGSVTGVLMTIDPQTGTVAARVTIAIEPLRLNLAGIKAPANGNWRPITDAALNKLFGRGYRAAIGQDPPLIGSSYIGIDHDASSGPAELVYDGADPILPSRTPRDMSSIVDEFGAIADKLNGIPIAAIGENVRQLTAHLNKLVGSPEVADSVKHLDSTLNQIDGMMKDVRPKIGPLVNNLNKAADQLQQTASSANKLLGGAGASQDAGLPDAIRELTEAARSIRSLTDYLGRHPEAILKGKPNGQ